MEPKMHFSHFLRNYGFTVDPESSKTLGTRGIFYVHPIHKDEKIAVYDDGRIYHIRNNQKIATIKPEDLENYLKRTFKH